MGHFAKVVDGIVTQVIVAEPEFFATFIDSTPGEWVQTSYNTYAGAHTQGGNPLRKNFAGKGYTYNPIKDAFIPPQPYPSWQLNEYTCQWEPPYAPPIHSTNVGTKFYWDEPSLSWKELK